MAGAFIGNEVARTEKSDSAWISEHGIPAATFKRAKAGESVRGDTLHLIERELGLPADLLGYVIDGLTSTVERIKGIDDRQRLYLVERLKAVDAERDRLDALAAQSGNRQGVIRDPNKLD